MANQSPRKLTPERKRRKPLSLPPHQIQTINRVADPIVTKCTLDALSLLRTHGILTLAQLEYNLPPNREGLLQQVLEVLECAGVVRCTGDAYAFLDGEPRVDDTPPHLTLTRLEEVREEIRDSEARIEVLKGVLRSDEKGREEVGNVLKGLLESYPNLVADSVYSMAFKNCKLDSGGVKGKTK